MHVSGIESEAVIAEGARASDDIRTNETNETNISTSGIESGAAIVEGARGCDGIETNETNSSASASYV